ncbi:MAG: SBBP repeat-containing protein [Synechococcales cyanobacterium M58_A2018_015]|nr:SBBP repeat-containing protein [Synechococcales cyanobacterium M58_A2018_015]
MARDIARNTLAAAKTLNLAASLPPIRDALSSSDRSDLFRVRVGQRSRLDLTLETTKGSVIGVQVFSLRGARNRMLRAIGRQNFDELKLSDIRKHLQLIGSRTVTHSKDGEISLDLQPGEYFMRLFQRSGNSRYRFGVDAQPVVATPSPTAPNRPNAPNPTAPSPTAPATLAPTISFSRRWLQTLGTSGNDYSYGTTVDRAGNLYVAGVANANNGPAGDGFVAKFAANGSLLWRRSIDTPGADVAFDVAVDDLGNYYVTGATVTGSGTATNSDVFVTKYSSDGTQQWIRTIATTVNVVGVNRNALDAGLGIALDGGNLFVSGLVGAFPLPALGKGFIAKYDAATGTLATDFGGSGTGRVEFGTDATAATDLVVSNGILYTTGISGAAVSLSGGSIRPSGGNAFVAAFSGASGSTLWNQSLSSGTTQDYARGIAVSGADVYITGQTSGTLPSGSTAANTFTGGRSDAFVAKYSNTGALQWVRQFGTNGIDEAQGIAVDSSGTIYVTGESDRALFGTSFGRTDAWVAQYDSSGNRTGGTQFGTDREDEAYGITVDAAGNVYLAGQTQGVFTGTTSAGRYEVWVAQYGVLPTA